MTHITLKNLITTCEAAAMNATYKEIAASISASESLMFHWRRQSLNAKAAGAQELPWFFEFRDGVWSYWHEKIAAAKNEYYMRFVGKIVGQVMDGISEVARGPSGEILYQERPEYIGVSDDAVALFEACELTEVARARLVLKDGVPQPQLKISQVAAPIRLRILESSEPRFRSVTHSQVDMQVSGGITVQKPLERLASEPKPSMERLRYLASLDPTARRAELGASAVPALKGPTTASEAAPSHQQQPVRPSSRSNQSLDRSDGKIPDGGGPANAPGNIR